MKPTIALLLFLLFFSGCASTQTTSTEDKAKLYIEMGTGALTRGDLPQAVEDLRKAIQLNSNNPVAHNHLGLAYYALGKKDLAKDEVQRSVMEDPNYSDGYINLGNFAAEEKNYPLAKHYYTKALQNLEYKYRHRAFTNMAQVEIYENNYVKAKELLVQAIQSNPDFCMSHFLMGTIYNRENNFKLAAESFAKSIQKTCVNNPESHYQLGLSYLQLKKYDKARSQFVFLVSEFPQTIQAQKAGDKLKYIP